MQLEQVLTELGLPDSRELLEPHWEESEASLPEQGPAFLRPREISASRECLRLAPEAEPVVQAAAERVRENPALLHLAWHCYRLLFYHRDYESSRIARWPTLERTLGDLAGPFYLLLAMASPSLIRPVHLARGIPEAITRLSCGHFPELIGNYRMVRGDQRAWGIDLRVLYWLRHYVAGDLYTLGRMEYMVRPFWGTIRAFRHRDTNEVVALAGEGTRFNAEGFINADQATDAEGGWTARLVEESGLVRGCPISPAGVGLRDEVELPLASWRRVLAPGDPILDTHIPAGGGMTPERCADTMRRALEFFPRYLPDRPFVGFACGSWILNPQLEWIYSPTSNMVLWQRELYLFPIPSGGQSGLYFIFGQDDPDPATAPRDTSLRRALLDQVAAGGRVIAGGMFFLKEDFPHFGSQYYRRHWPPKAL